MFNPEKLSLKTTIAALYDLFTDDPEINAQIATVIDLTDPKNDAHYWHLSTTSVAGDSGAVESFSRYPEAVNAFRLKANSYLINHEIVEIFLEGEVFGEPNEHNLSKPLLHSGLLHIEQIEPYCSECNSSNVDVVRVWPKGPKYCICRACEFRFVSLEKE